MPSKSARLASRARTYVVYLIHLAVDLAVSSSLEDLVPLLRHWVELVHVVCAALRVCPREEIEEASVLDDSMACSGCVDYLVVDVRLLVLDPVATAADLALLALFIVHVLLRNHSLPLSDVEVVVELLVVDVHVLVVLHVATVVVVVELLILVSLPIFNEHRMVSC